MHNQLVRNAAVVLTLLSACVAQTSPHAPAEVVQAFHAALAAGDSSGAWLSSRQMSWSTRQEVRSSLARSFGHTI